MKKLRTIEIKRMTAEQDINIKEDSLKWNVGYLADSLMKAKETLAQDEQTISTLERTLVYLEEMERYVKEGKALIAKMVEDHKTLELINKIEKELNS